MTPVENDLHERRPEIDNMAAGSLIRNLNSLQDLRHSGPLAQRRLKSRLANESTLVFSDRTLK